MFIRIRKSAAVVYHWRPSETRYRFYICRSERRGSCVVRRDLAYVGAILDEELEHVGHVERIYRETEAAVTKIGATAEDLGNVLRSLARWRPRPDPNDLTESPAVRVTQQRIAERAGVSQGLVSRYMEEILRP